MLNIFEQLLTHAQTGNPLALCTLISAKGSCPQSAGAKMIVLQSGHTIGTLGGGCVEAEVRQKALRQITRNQSQLLTFKLDSDYGWDDGLICGGTMQVYIQVLARPGDVDPFIAFAGALRSRTPTEFRLTIPTESGEQTYLEPLPPKPILLIAGAGHVGHSLGRLAADLDFDLAVLDDRPDFVTQTRFPTAAQLLTGNIEHELRRFPIDTETYIVIVTRGHKNDGAALRAVIRSPAKYIGVIGSKRKIITILADLARQEVPTELLKKVHAPIGLAIGAITPAEIGVSIAAHLVAVRRNHLLPAQSMQLPPELLDQALAKKDALIP